MVNTDNINLGNVQKTLLLPLWGRAVETNKENPVYTDNLAAEIINKIPYDFKTLSKNISEITRMSWIARNIYFEEKLKNFITACPEAVIINAGCGLDTLFFKADNGKITWYDLDFPDVIELKREYISEQDRYVMIAGSVLDTSWHSKIKNQEHVMIVFAGVLYYFSEDEIKNLFTGIQKTFPSAEIIFDYCSAMGMKTANKAVIKRSGMEKSAYLKWGLNDIRQLEKWDDSIQILHYTTMFKEYMKKLPAIKRIALSILDLFKIMSLAHVRI